MNVVQRILATWAGIPHFTQADLDLGADVAVAMLRHPDLNPAVIALVFDEVTLECLLVVGTTVYRESPKAAYTMIRQVLQEGGFLSRMTLDRVRAVDPEPGTLTQPKIVHKYWDEGADLCRS